jgi:hypothetical protein
LPIPWDRKLQNRPGGKSRLGGLEIYFDFDWLAMFGHDRAVFPRGQSLAQLVTKDCPAGKAPALLLTERTDVEAHIEETRDKYIVIVPIHDYLANAGADAASTYYARMSGTPLTLLTSLSEVSFTPSELTRFLGVHLEQEVLVRWAANSPERSEILRRVAAMSNAASSSDVAGEIRRLGAADPAAFEAMGEYIERFGEDGGIRRLLARLTESELGRMLTADVLSKQLVGRIADTRRKLTEYQALIAEPDATETDVQRFLEINPWIVGLPYVSAQARVEIPRGELDFVLNRYDGFFDIVELKSPGEDLVRERTKSESVRPASASAYSLGPALARALAQAHHYRSILNDSRDLAGQYGLKDTREPNILILVGRSTSMTQTGGNVLRELNYSLHRVEIIPYDLLGQRTEGFLGNIESLMSGPGPS